MHRQCGIIIRFQKMYLFGLIIFLIIESNFEYTILIPDSLMSEKFKRGLRLRNRLRPGYKVSISDFNASM